MRKINVFQLDRSMRREAWMDLASSTFLWSTDGEQSQPQGNRQGCPEYSQKAPFSRWGALNTKKKPTSFPQNFFPT